MRKFYLFFDYSINSSWLNESIYNSEDFLNLHNIYFAPFDYTDKYLPKLNHSFFYANNDNINDYIKNKFESIDKLIDDKHDVLFIFNCQVFKLVEKFFSCIKRKYYNIDFTTLFLVSKPSLLFELWLKEIYVDIDENLIKRYEYFATSISYILFKSIEQFGSDKTILILDLSDSIDEEHARLSFSKVMDALGIDIKYRKVSPLTYPTFFNTHTAVRLVKASQVHHNSWPSLDITSYAKALLFIDQNLNSDPISMLKTRLNLKFHLSLEQKRLASLLRINADDLNPPFWFYTQESTDSKNPIKSSILNDFVHLLPSHVHHVLLQRFNLDRKLLNCDQKLLQAALIREKRCEFKTISELTQPPLLTVLTLTYNHEKYISECIESILAQKTKFQVQHIILDHYSTDSTSDIINKYSREYPSIRPVLLKNLSRIYNNVYELFIRCSTDFVSLCDGDDYFTDNLKLQKQVDFLENHTRCALCFHLVKVIFENSAKTFVFPQTSMLPRGIKSEYYMTDLLRGNIIQTNSVVYRWRFKNGLPDWFDPTLCPGDFYWHILHAENGKIGFIPEVMSVYRRHLNSLYQYSFVDDLLHRKTMGMQELNTYYVINKHFHDRYFFHFAKLANSIFTDFLKLSLNGIDENLFNEACNAYPKFANYFLREIKIFTSRKNQDKDFNA